MGIPKFFNYIEKNYSKGCISEDKTLNPRQTYDYLFLDYQSLIYNAYSVFSCEVNYLIRMLMHVYLSIEYTNINVYTKEMYEIAIYIYNKYINYFRKICNNKEAINMIPSYTNDKGNIAETIKSFNDCMLTTNENIIIDFLSDFVVDHTKNLANNHIQHNDIYARTYIYFDGIPSIAKIKEQVGRSIFPDIMKEIKTNIYHGNGCLLNIESHLLKEYPPSIGLDTPIINMLRVKLAAINDQVKGQFVINNVNDYGEAEHQIMKYINSDIKFKNVPILLSSPDADLILLSLINRTNKINIDLIREASITENDYRFNHTYDKKEKVTNSPYYRSYTYININQLKINLNFTSDQKLVDICFSLLLLGDDFIPIIPTMSIDNFESIIGNYDNLVTINSTFKIINLNTNPKSIEYNNLLKLFEELQLNEEESEKKIESKFYKSIYINDTHIDYKYATIHKFYYYDYLPPTDISAFKKYYYAKEGYIIDSNNKKKNLTNNYNYYHYNVVEDQIKNYLEGCQFIFDIYINNNLQDYKWYYKYYRSPPIIFIVKFIKENIRQNFTISDLFNYKYDNNVSYLDTANYIKYMNDNKDNIINNIIGYIIDNTYHIVDDTTPLKDLKTRLFTLDNIEYIFPCLNNQTYFNKCIPFIELLDVAPYLVSNINKQLLRGKYYKKYLKYKNKYILLNKV